MKYNCFGELHTSLDLVISGLFDSCEALFDDDSWCSDDFYFDYHADVVACCGEYDMTLKPKYQEFCMYDLYEQLCFSLAARLEYLIQKGEFGIYASKAEKLQKYVAARHKECFEAFKINNVAALPHVETHWALQDDFGLLANVVFHINADTRIDGVNAPDFAGEWPKCNGASYNDENLFSNTSQPPIGGIALAVELAAPVHVELSGPVVLGGAVSATAEFGAACTVAGCPASNFSYDQDGWGFGLEAFSLFGDSFEVSNGQHTFTGDRVQIRLYTPAEGTEIFDGDDGFRGYEIPPGEATFIVSAAADDVTSWVMAANSTGIEVVPHDEGGWEIDAFLLDYEDENHELWTLVIGESQWQ